MLPKWHAFWGLIFTIIFKILAPKTNYVSLFLIFFAAVFIDFDHYLTTAIKNKDWSLRRAFKINYDGRAVELDLKKNKGICRKGDFHIFHTVESHLLIGILGFLWAPLFFILIGMILHSTLDIIWMTYHDVLGAREFFLFNKIRAVFF